ncbi:hypothetical protein [Actinomadura xylanilytica]|uniref:hypothetical protein n=1 Tax=Actinomadura xylanilytica TaxID=887459 RepID=UPI0032E4F434
MANAVSNSVPPSAIRSTRMPTVQPAAWREAPYFTDEERAALALAEAATRPADRPDAVNDEVWDTAATYSTRSRWPRSS